MLLLGHQAGFRFKSEVERGANAVDRLRVDETVVAGRPCVADVTKVKVSDIVVHPNEALVDSIDTALADLLGTRAREAIYDHLARQHLLAKEDVPTHLDEFRSVMKVTFGASATTIEKFIARRLYASLGWQFLDFAGFGLNEHLEFINGIVERAKRMNFPQ